MKRFTPCMLLFVVLLSGCSMRTLVVNQTADVFKGAMPAFEKDWDYELVEVALPGNMKMIEAFLEAGPKNADLLFLSAQAYSAYGLIFLEDRMERALIKYADADENPEAERYAMRAKEMHMRGHRYGLRLMETRRPGFWGAFTKGGEALDKALAECDKDDVPGLFWSGMPIAAATNLDREDVELIASVPKAKAIILRALELDETYYNAGPHMILGSIYGSLSPTLGGDYKKSKQHFDRALELTRRRFLLVQVMYAKTLAVQTQNKKLYKDLLNEVLKAELSIYPDQKLANVAAQRRARRMLKTMDDLF